MSNKVKGNLSLALMLAVIIAVTLSAVGNITGGFSDYVAEFVGKTFNAEESVVLTVEGENPFQSQVVAEDEAVSLVKSAELPNVKEKQ